MNKSYIVDKIFEKINFANNEILEGEYENCKFINCDFANADLSNYIFSDCEFKDCNLSLVKLLNTSFRDVKFKKCKLLGCHFDPKQAGLFMWAAIPTGYSNGYQLCDEILQQSNVFITPGGIFGTAGDQYIRVSLCSSAEKITAAIERIRESVTSTGNNL